MLQSVRDRVHEETVLAANLLVTNVSAALTKLQTVVRCTNTAGSITITLPAVADCVGRIFTVKLTTKTGSNTVTIAHKGDSEAWTNLTLDATGERTAVYSDGFNWYVLEAPAS